ncbi:MAG: hypothetical protein GC202_02060 [Alphaproteobacteria bacterium]|nr:hypothetical protein [Alphaproteobacteria bacterium]
MLPVSARDTVPFVPFAYDLAAATAPVDSVPADPAMAQKLSDERAAHLDAVHAALKAVDGKPPTYHVRVPSLRARAAWRRDVAQAGARMPSNGDLFEALRAALREVGPANLDELLEKVDHAEAMASGRIERDSGLAREVAALETQLMASPTYAVLVAARTYWYDVAPVIAASHFLAGWDNVDIPFVSARGLVPEETLRELPQGHAVEIGFKAISMMAVSGQDAKNSASRSPSPAALQLTQAARDPQMAAAGGNSMGNSTSETQPSISKTDSGT